LNSNVISSPGTLGWSSFLSCCNYYQLWLSYTPWLL